MTILGAFILNQIALFSHLPSFFILYLRIVNYGN